jgi:hypothetical protein
MTGTHIMIMSTVFDTNRDKVTTVSGNDLVGDMGPSPGNTGADLRAALTGTKPPDDAFAVSIAEAISMVTSDCLPLQRAAGAAVSSRASVTPDRSGVPGSAAIAISNS